MFKYNGLIFACIFISMCLRQVNAEGLDPTRPLGYGSRAIVALDKEPESIVLSSILIANNRKIAIINDQQLHESEIIKGIGAQVKRIDADAVTLQQGQKVWRVPLNQTIIRK